MRHNWGAVRVVALVLLITGMLFGCSGESGGTGGLEQQEAGSAGLPGVNTQPETNTNQAASEVVPNPESLSPIALTGAPPEIGAASETGVQSLSLSNLCGDIALGASEVVIPVLPKPALLEPYLDPAFGSRVTRITDSSFGEVSKPMYSTVQSWNADESYLMLYKTGGSDIGHHLYNGQNYAHIRKLDISPVDLEQVFWSRSNPDEFFYVSRGSSERGSFRRFSVSANQSEEITNFESQCGSGLPGNGNDVQMHAVNDDLFGFSCQQDDGHHIMFSYKPSTGDIATAPTGTGSPWLPWSAPVPAASGNRFWHQGHVLANDLVQVNHQLDMDNWYSHASTGMTADGQDAYYQTAFNVSPNGCNGDLYQGVGHLIEHNMETGECRSIISEQQGYPYTTSSTHVSSLAFNLPARVAMSSIGRADQFSHFSNGIAAPALLSEVYVAQTTVNDTAVCRLAHHRSFGKSASNGGYEPYFGEPHATISPSGTRILFGSDWYDSGSVDTFVVELPDWNQ